jgi:hypothetical protein
VVGDFLILNRKIIYAAVAVAIVLGVLAVIGSTVPAEVEAPQYTPPQQGLSASQTGNRIGDISSRISVLLSESGTLADKVGVGELSLDTFAEEMGRIKKELTALQIEVAELEEDAHPDFLEAIRHFKQGLNYYIEAYGYAENLELDKASEYIKLGTEETNKATEALPS